MGPPPNPVVVENHALFSQMQRESTPSVVALWAADSRSRIILHLPVLQASTVPCLRQPPQFSHKRRAASHHIRFQERGRVGLRPGRLPTILKKNNGGHVGLGLQAPPFCVKSAGAAEAGAVEAFDTGVLRCVTSTCFFLKFSLRRID